MNRSPLLFSCTLIASLSLLTTASAWSAPESQDKPKATADAKAKPAKTKKHKVKAKIAHKATPIKLASADTGKFVPAASSAVTTNPYLAGQPAAILPKAANPYMVNPVVTALVTSAAVAAVPVVSTPTPAAAAPIVVQKPAAAAPITSQPPAAIMPASAPMAAYQPWSNTPPAQNAYLANQQAYAMPDPVKLFSQFGDGLKMSLPNFAQPATPTASGQHQANLADTTNSFNSIFTSLKGLLPLSGDSILPVIKTVYPTGEKPLVVINFKCPTEVIGISTPPMKVLHEILNFGFDGLNKTNLLSFNIQQVCS